MSVEQTNPHKEIVHLWEEKNLQGPGPEQVIKIYGSAILAVEQRCLDTLSSVTVQVVLDRVLHEGLENYSLLSTITIGPKGLNLSGLNHKNENYKLEEITESLRYLLIEFLTVIGNITSEVLTTPLHKELMEVTHESALTILEVQNLHTLNTAKKRGER